MVPPACTPTAGASTPWPGGTSRSGSRTASWTGPWRPAVTPLFVNRTKELAALTRWWATQEQAADCVKAEPQRTLERLVELRLVERVMPVGESERSKRRLGWPGVVLVRVIPGYTQGREDCRVDSGAAVSCRRQACSAPWSFSQRAVRASPRAARGRGAGRRGDFPPR